MSEPRTTQTNAFFGLAENTLNIMRLVMTRSGGKADRPAWDPSGRLCHAPVLCKPLCFSESSAAAAGGLSQSRSSQSLIVDRVAGGRLAVATMQPATMWAAAAGGVITRGAPLLGKGGSSHHEPLLRAGSSRTACSIIHKHRSIGAGRRALVVSPLAKKGNGGGGSDQEKKGTKRSGKKNETEVLEAIRNSSNGNGVGGNHHDGGNGKAPTGGKNGEQQLFRSGVTGTRADAAAATPIEKVPKPKTYDLTKRCGRRTLCESQFCTPPNLLPSCRHLFQLLHEEDFIIQPRAIANACSAISASGCPWT